MHAEDISNDVKQSIYQLLYAMLRMSWDMKTLQWSRSGFLRQTLAGLQYGHHGDPGVRDILLRDIVMLFA